MPVATTKATLLRDKAKKSRLSPLSQRKADKVAAIKERLAAEKLALAKPRSRTASPASSRAPSRQDSASTLGSPSHSPLKEAPSTVLVVCVAPPLRARSDVPAAGTC